MAESQSIRRNRSASQAGKQSPTATFHSTPAMIESCRQSISPTARGISGLSSGPQRPQYSHTSLFSSSVSVYVGIDGRLMLNFLSNSPVVRATRGLFILVPGGGVVREVAIISKFPSLDESNRATISPATPV